MTSDPWIDYARREINATYGDDVSIEAKDKALIKFGANEAIGASRASIMTLPSGVLHETYVSSNAITQLSSADAGDTQAVIVEGHTISGSDLTFSTQSATLNGQNIVNLTTPLARITRIRNNSGTDFTGPIYGAETDTVTAGVPDTASKVHIIVPAGYNTSLKASTSLSSVDYWIITQVYADCLEKTAAFAAVALEIRESGKTFIQRFEISATTNSPGRAEFHPYIIAPPNSDVRLTAVANTANIHVSGGIVGALAKAGPFVKEF